MRVPIEVPEAARKGDLIVGRDLLVRKDEDDVLEERLANAGEHGIIDLAQVDIDLRANQTRKRRRDSVETFGRKCARCFTHG